MNILLILIPITLILVTIGVLVFNWAVKSGQYDDLEGPAHRILYDDDRDMIPEDAKQPHQRSNRSSAAEDSTTESVEGDQDPQGDNPEKGA